MISDSAALRQWDSDRFTVVLGLCGSADLTCWCFSECLSLCRLAVATASPDSESYYRLNHPLHCKYLDGEPV